MKSGWMVGLLVVALVAIPASALPVGPVINVGTHPLLANTPGQQVQLFVTGTDQVTGFNLGAVLGDGTGPGLEPVFTDANFTTDPNFTATNSIWNAYPNTVIGGVVAPSDIQASVVFNTSGNLVQANGLLVTLTIDTTGFTSGTYALSLTADNETGGSQFITTGGATIAANITNGFITIPEPATMSLLGLALAGLVARRRRKA